MAKRIETYGCLEWLQTIDKRFKVVNTRLNITEETFTVFLSNEITGMNNIIVARYCRVTRLGVIMDRRTKETRDYDHTNVR